MSWRNRQGDVHPGHWLASEQGAAIPTKKYKEDWERAGDPVHLDIVTPTERALQNERLTREAERLRRKDEAKHPVENFPEPASIAKKAGRVPRLLTQEPYIGTMDAAARIRRAREYLSSVYPEERVRKLLKDLAAETARETTGHANEQPRPDWIEARKQPGKRADVLAAFINEKFAAEIADGTMSTDKFFRYTSLYQAFQDHRAELPPDLRSLPTKSRSLDRQVKAGKIKPVRPPAPRTKEQKAFDRDTRRVQRAERRLSP
jgi:hypothetical protein